MNKGIAVPDQSAEARTDKAPSLRPRQKRWALVSLVLLAILIALLVGVTRFPTHSHATAARSSPTAAQASVRLTGKIQAVRSRVILAPLLAGQQVGTLTIVKMAASGSHVKQGDLLVDFDREAQLKDFVDKRAQSDDQNGKVMEAQAAEMAAKSKDETELEQAGTALSKAKLEMQRIELKSRIDAEKLQEDLDEARATLAQLKETFDLKRKAAQAAIHVLEIQRDRTREVMMHAQTNASLMQIHAPIDGIVVLNTIWKEGTMGEVKEGDQVRPGITFMQVVDPSMMEVQVMVNQEDLAKLTLGQSAQVHLDAYPDITLTGRLESIDPMGKPGGFSSRIRNFSATFSVKGSDPRLMPDLSAAVDIQAVQQPNNLSASR